MFGFKDFILNELIFFYYKIAKYENTTFKYEIKIKKRSVKYGDGDRYE